MPSLEILQFNMYNNFYNNKITSTDLTYIFKAMLMICNFE